MLNSVSAGNELAEQGVGGVSGSHDVSPDQAHRPRGIVQFVREQIVTFSRTVRESLPSCPKRRGVIGGQPMLYLSTLEPEVAQAVANIQMTIALKKALRSISKEHPDRAPQVMKELGLDN